MCRVASSICEENIFYFFTYGTPFSSAIHPQNNLLLALSHLLCFDIFLLIGGWVFLMLEVIDNAGPCVVGVVSVGSGCWRRGSVRRVRFQGDYR